MNAHEMLEAHALETGAAHVGSRLSFQRWGRDDVVHAAADPNRDVQEIGAGLIGFVGLTHFIFIHSAEEKAADIYGMGFREHRSEQTASLRPAGEPRKRDRPIPALGPILSDRL